MVYLITYDLHKIKNYAPLIDCLKKLNNCIHPLESFWLIDSPLPLQKLNDLIRSVVDADDEYYITTISNRGAGRISQGSIDWLDRKFSTVPLALNLKPQGLQNSAQPVGLKPLDLRKDPNLKSKLGLDNLKKNQFPPKL